MIGTYRVSIDGLGEVDEDFADKESAVAMVKKLHELGHNARAWRIVASVDLRNGEAV